MQMREWFVGRSGVAAIFVAATLLGAPGLMTGCTEDAGVGSGRDLGWMLGEGDTGATQPGDMTTQPDTRPPVQDMAPPPPQDMAPPPAQDMAPPPQDMSLPPRPDGGTTDQPCARNLECSAGELCCPQIGQQTGGLCKAEADCRLSGGFCQVDDECDGTSRCCESRLLQGQKTCQDNCPTPQVKCTDNSDCATAGDVCCPQLNGDPVCEPRSQCAGGQIGGICTADTQCTGAGETCCDTFGSSDKLCRTNCMTTCQTNPDCTGAGEVCCPDTMGNRSCVPHGQCEILGQPLGGTCAMKSDCTMPGEQCCTFGTIQVCRNRCGF